MNEQNRVIDNAVMSTLMPMSFGEFIGINGVYTAQCFEVMPEHKEEYDAIFAKQQSLNPKAAQYKLLQEELDSFPKFLKWEEEFNNVVCVTGKNLMLDTLITGSAYTATGPYMGLISSVSWTNLNTTLASLATYASATGIVSINTTAAHGLGVNDTFTIAAAAGTGTNIASLNGTFLATSGTTASVLNFFVGVGLTITTVTGGTLTTVSGTRAADTMASHANWLEAGSTNAPTFTARVAPAWSAAANGAKATSAAVSYTMTSAGTLQGAFITLGTGAVTTLMSTAGTLFSAGAFAASQAVSNGNTVTVTYSVSS